MITTILAAIGLYIAWKVLKMGVRVAMFLAALALLFGSQLKENPTALIGFPKPQAMYSDFVNGMKEGYTQELTRAQQATTEWLKGDLKADELQLLKPYIPNSESQSIHANMERQEDPEFLAEVARADNQQTR